MTGRGLRSLCRRYVNLDRRGVVLFASIDGHDPEAPAGIQRSKRLGLPSCAVEARPHNVDSFPRNLQAIAGLRRVPLLYLRFVVDCVPSSPFRLTVVTRWFRRRLPSTGVPGRLFE